MAGDTPGPVETVIAWSGGRRLHLLTWGAMSEGRRASVPGELGCCGEASHGQIKERLEDAAARTAPELEPSHL